MKWVVLRYRKKFDSKNEQSHAFFDENRLPEVMRRYNIEIEDVKTLHVNDERVDIRELLEHVRG